MIENIIEQISGALKIDPTPVLEEKANPSGHGTVAVVKEGYRLEKLPGKQKNARKHVFHDPRSLAEWLNREADAGATDILVAQKDIACCLTPEDPHGDMVRCEMQHSPEFVAWSGAFAGRSFSQKDLHAFIRGNLQSFSGDGGPVNPGKVLASDIQKLSVNSGKEFTGELDPMGYYRFQGGTGRAAVEGSIPPSFEIEIPVFVGVARPNEESEIRYPLEVLVSIDIDDDRDEKCSFKLSCPSLPLVLHQARIDTATFLRSLLNDGFLVGLGVLAVQPVPVIELA